MENNGGECSFMEERRKLGESVMNKSPLEESEIFMVLTASHWLSRGGFSMAGFLLVKEKIDLSFSPAEPKRAGTSVCLS